MPGSLSKRSFSIPLSHLFSAFRRHRNDLIETIEDLRIQLNGSGPLSVLYDIERKFIVSITCFVLCAWTFTSSQLQLTENTLTNTLLNTVKVRYLVHFRGNWIECKLRWTKVIGKSIKSNFLYLIPFETGDVRLNELPNDLERATNRNIEFTHPNCPLRN